MSQLLPLAKIAVDRTLAHRDTLDDWSGAGELLASIGRAGVLRPVVVSGPSMTLMAGFRRVEALRRLGQSEVPAQVSARPPLELHVEAVEEHAGQGANLREVARAIQIGQQLGLSLEQAARRLLPPLGLEPHPDLAARYLELLRLPPPLLSFFVDKGFSLRRCLPFCRLERGEAEVAARMAAHLKGGGKLEQATTQLQELAAREDAPMAGLARELGFFEGDPEALSRLEARRMPETTRRRRELDGLCRELAAQQLAVRYDPSFTSEEVELVLSVRSVDDLSSRLEQLGEAAARERLGRVLRAALGE
jgi:ParB-like chromosome segregation protein Spo0J